MVYPCFFENGVTWWRPTWIKKMHKGDFRGLFGTCLGRCPCIIAFCNFIPGSTPMLLHYNACDWMKLTKQETLNQRRVNTGPAKQTVSQHWLDIGSTSLDSQVGITVGLYPANTRHWHNVVLIMCGCCGRANIRTTLSRVCGYKFSEF